MSKLCYEPRSESKLIQQSEIYPVFSSYQDKELKERFQQLKANVCDLNPALVAKCITGTEQDFILLMNRAKDFIRERFRQTSMEEEKRFVRDGIVVSGYMQDNIMDQHIDDEIVRSVHGANKSSGIKSVIVYKVTGTKEEVIYLDTTYHQFVSPDTHSFFDVYYDINQTEDAVDYYLIITRDFAGNQTKKKLTSQRTLLTMFRTSIDRGAY